MIRTPTYHLLAGLKLGQLPKILTGNDFTRIRLQNRFATSFNSGDEKPKEANFDRIFTVPNFLTTARIASVPFVNYFVLINKHEYACALFFVSGLTDFFDGYIARNFKNQQSNLGSILDPLADKLLVCSLTVTLTIYGMMPFALAATILGRDVVLVLYSLYVRYRMIEKPVTLSKYVNVKKYATVQVQPDRVSKVNTALQIALITFTLPSVVFGYQDSSWLIALQFLTGTTTVLSSLSYLYKRGSYKVVK